jgi:hypothetical protein
LREKPRVIFTHSLGSNRGHTSYRDRAFEKSRQNRFHRSEFHVWLKHSILITSWGFNIPKKAQYVINLRLIEQKSVVLFPRTTHPPSCTWTIKMIRSQRLTSKVHWWSCFLQLTAILEFCDYFKLLLKYIFAVAGSASMIPNQYQNEQIIVINNLFHLPITVSYVTT